MSNQAPTFTVPAALMQEIVNYLQERPHKEVRALIDGILACNPRPKPPAAAADAPPPPKLPPNEEPGLAPEPVLEK